MAFAATAIWEIRTTGSDANGGGFDPTSGVPGTDYSQQNAAQVAYTDLVINGATNTDCTSTLNPFTAAHVGNIVNVTGGTGFTVQRVQVMSVTAGVARMDKSLGTLSSTGGTGNLGGALLTPGLCGGLMVAGNDVHQKAGTYTVTSATPNIAGGCVSLPAGASASNKTKWTGYQTTRGDGGTKPIIVADGVITTFALFATGLNNYVENITVDGNSRTSSRGFSNAGNSLLYRCKAQNCTNSGFISASIAALAALCEATGCATVAAFSNMQCYACVAYSNTFTGFQSGIAGTSYIGCLSINNSGASSHGFLHNALTGQCINCTAYNNGADGFRGNVGAVAQTFINCLSVGNAGYGFNASAAHEGMMLFYCAGYNPGGTGNVNATNIVAAQQIGFVALSASPFNDAAGGNFGLNSTASAGAACRQSGIPGAFPGVSTTGYPDIGAVQAIVSSSGIGVLAGGGLVR